MEEYSVKLQARKVTPSPAHTPSSPSTGISPMEIDATIPSVRRQQVNADVKEKSLQTHTHMHDDAPPLVDNNLSRDLENGTGGDVGIELRRELGRTGEEDASSEGSSEDGVSESSGMIPSRGRGIIDGRSDSYFSSKPGNPTMWIRGSLNPVNLINRENKDAPFCKCCDDDDPSHDCGCNMLSELFCAGRIRVGNMVVFKQTKNAQGEPVLSLLGEIWQGVERSGAKERALISYIYLIIYPSSFPLSRPS